MGVFSFVKAGGKKFGSIVGVGPKVNKTKLDKAKSKLAIATQKTKASGAKLKQTLFESKNKAFKGNDFTFSSTKAGKGKQLRDKKMGGGMMGRRMGYQAGSKKGKVPTTPKEKAFGMLSVNKGLDNNKNITFTDKIAGATGGKKKKKA